MLRFQEWSLSWEDIKITPTHKEYSIVEGAIEFRVTNLTNALLLYRYEENGEWHPIAAHSTIRYSDIALNDNHKVVFSVRFAYKLPMNGGFRIEWVQTEGR